MSVNTISSNTTNNVLNSTAVSTVTGTASTADATTTASGFKDMLAQSSILPTQSLSPEVLAATVSSTTVPTSDYVFDALSVVGIVPESNTFLQAIRQMMGKPLTPTATEPSPTASTPLTTFDALPPATPAMPTAVSTAVVSTPTPTPTPTPTSTPTTSGTSSNAGSSSIFDLLSTIEAQLNYQSNDTSATATTTPSTPTSETSVAAASETVTPSLTPNAATNATQTAPYGDLVQQYLTGASTAASASVESALIKAMDQEPQAA